MIKEGLIFGALSVLICSVGCNIYAQESNLLEERWDPIATEDCLPDSSNLTVYKVCEVMPRFPGCEELKRDNAEKKKCADELLLAYVYDNLAYYIDNTPDLESGHVVVRFNVEESGCLSNVSIVRDNVGGEASEEVRWVIDLMNLEGKRWTPGTQRGKKVRVQFNLPVAFEARN